jgi:hypothetical protein
MLPRISCRRAHRLVTNTNTRWRRLSTYYDSQSGMHVAVHKEGEVTAYCSWESEWDKSKLEMLAKRGVAGVLIGPESFDLSEILQLPDSFTMFLPKTLLPPEWPLSKLTNRNVTVVFPLDDCNRMTTEMTPYMDQSISTAVHCEHDDNQDVILVANQVGQLLDDIGGGNNVIVSGENDLVELCEELCYLDLVGPTMKSRLVVEAVSQDTREDNHFEIVEECLRMGINKFVVSERQLPWLGQLVLDQGKSCTFQF